MSEAAEISGRFLMAKAKAACDDGLAVTVWVSGREEPIPATGIEIETRTARITTPGVAVYYVALPSVFAIGTAPA